ncbi:unnamed protein product [Moneuplotes crassus]|uniref:Uncharacterized protein n=1 Tax=Euplotes crassus TaxID=5936 RepID=A0AAD1YAC7_EUPCR|nr:unnamed protein product [Moneuplotes crassus]
MSISSPSTLSSHTSSYISDESGQETDQKIETSEIKPSIVVDSMDNSSEFAEYPISEKEEVSTAEEKSKRKLSKKNSKEKLRLKSPWAIIKAKKKARKDIPRGGRKSIKTTNFLPKFTQIGSKRKTILAVKFKKAKAGKGKSKKIGASKRKSIKGPKKLMEIIPEEVSKTNLLREETSKIGMQMEKNVSLISTIKQEKAIMDESQKKEMNDSITASLQNSQYQSIEEKVEKKPELVFKTVMVLPVKKSKPKIDMTKNIVSSSSMKKILHSSTKKIEPFGLIRNGFSVKKSHRRISRMTSKNSSSNLSVNSPLTVKHQRNNSAYPTGQNLFQNKSKFHAAGPIQEASENSNLFNLTSTKKFDLKSSSESLSSLDKVPESLIKLHKTTQKAVTSPFRIRGKPPIPNLSKAKTPVEGKISKIVTQMTEMTNIISKVNETTCNKHSQSKTKGKEQNYQYQIKATLLNDNLALFEEKAQSLVLMFDSPKIYKIQQYFKRLSVKEQKACNKDLEQIIVALSDIGKNVTKGILKDLHSMGIRDTSFLVKKVGRCYDEVMTFKENEFLIKKAYEFFTQCFNCSKLYKMLYPLHLKNQLNFLKLLQSTRLTMNLFIERINTIKSRTQSVCLEGGDKRSQTNYYITKMIKRKGLLGNSVLRRPSHPNYYMLGDQNLTV